MTKILQINNCSKTYKSGFTLGPVQLSLEENHVYGCLGKNGAGKSTLFQLITGNIFPSDGQIFLNNQTLSPKTPHRKREIGYLPQHLSFPHWVSGRDILSYACDLYSIKNKQEKIETSLNYWDATDFAHKPLVSCSHGMQKRIALALSTINQPALLVLDEPFSGLDLYHTRSLMECIQERKKQGQTTLLSTHITPYVGQICDEVLLISQGQCKEIDQWQQLGQKERVDLIENEFFG